MSVLWLVLILCSVLIAMLKRWRGHRPISWSSNWTTAFSYYWLELEMMTTLDQKSNILKDHDYGNLGVGEAEAGNLPIDRCDLFPSARRQRIQTTTESGSSPYKTAAWTLS